MVVQLAESVLSLPPVTAATIVRDLQEFIVETQGDAEPIPNDRNARCSDFLFFFFCFSFHGFSRDGQSRLDCNLVALQNNQNSRVGRLLDRRLLQRPSAEINLLQIVIGKKKKKKEEWA